MGHIDFYYVDSDYIDFLKKAECEKRGFTCVPNVEYANRKKFLYGAVLTVNSVNYFVPVSSQINKNKEFNLEIKTKDKKFPKKGSLRFPYMIPVPNFCLKRLVIDEISEANRRILTAKELSFCRKNKDKIEKVALHTYESVKSKRNEKLVKNSCDFEFLEQKCLEYTALYKNQKQSTG